MSENNRLSPANQSRQTQVTASKHGARLFRTSPGLAWTTTKEKTVKVNATDVLLRDAHPIKTAIEGMSDNCGWVSVDVTADMVGSRVALYVAVEDKFGAGRTTPEQKAFIAAVRRSGGRAGVSRGDDDTVAILNGEIRD